MTNPEDIHVSDELKINDYASGVRYLASISKNSEFNNLGDFHAAIVLKAILDTTDTHFKMFSGYFNSKVADKKEFLTALDNYLNQCVNNGKTFSLFLEKIPSDDEKSEALKLVETYEAKSSNIQVKPVSASFLNELKTNPWCILN